MLLKFLLKIWPAFLPILVYIFWVYFIERVVIARIMKKKDIEEKVVGEGSTEVKKPGMFSLKNHRFVAVLYASLIMAIISLVFTAFSY